MSLFLKKRLKGFLLLEVALVFCILGVLGAALMPLLKTATQTSKNAQTQQAFDRAIRSLAAYATAYQRLPCAAQADGLECAGTYSGVIPYKTLGLEASWVQDGSGPPLSYIVTAELTNWNIVTDLDEEETPPFSEIVAKNPLQIIDESGEIVLPFNTDQKDFCAFVLVSIPGKAKVSGDSFLKKDAPPFVFHMPPRSSGVRARWMSRNNLCALFRPY